MFVRGCCPRCVVQGRVAEVAFVVVVIVCAFVVVVVNIVVFGCLLIVLRSGCVGV